MKDVVYVVVATWPELTPERQVWREGVFDTKREAVTAFEAYAGSYSEGCTPPVLDYIKEVVVDY